MAGLFVLTGRDIMIPSILQSLGRRPVRASFFMAKWVKIRDGLYKLVSDDDPRPSVQLPNKKMGAPFVPFTPSWKKHERDVWNDDTKRSMEATDKFVAEREHETKTDPRAARWEKSRKARWEKDKPAWVTWARKRGIRD